MQMTIYVIINKQVNKEIIRVNANYFIMVDAMQPTFTLVKL